MRPSRLSYWRIAAVIPLAVVGLGSIIATSQGGGLSAPPVVNNLDPSGVWQGTLTSDVTMNAVAVTAVITASGSARLILADGSQLSGSVVTNGDQVSGNLTGITELGLQWQDNTTVSSFTINGTVAQRSAITGTYTGAGDSGTLTLTFDSVYDRTSSLATLAGQWERLDALQNITATISFDAQGAIDGSDADGCIYSGTVSVSDSSVDVYTVSLTVANCVVSGLDLDGQYTGTGVLSDQTAGSNQNDAFLLAVSDNRFVITMRLNRI